MSERGLHFTGLPAGRPNSCTGRTLVVAAGLEGVDVLDLSKSLVTKDRTYVPDPSTKEAYERNFQVFRRLYKTNAANFRRMNA